MGETVIKKSNKKVIMLTLLAIVFIVAGGIIMYKGINDGSILLTVIGGICGGVFVGFLIGALKMSRSGDTLLILNDKGFYDYSSLIATKDQLIEWSEVSQIQYAEMSGQQFVNVQLKHPEETLRNQSDFAKKMAKANENLGFSGINVNAGIAVGYDGTELTNLMNDYFKQYEKIDV